MADNNVISLKTGEPREPDFITRVNISEMDDAALDEMLSVIAARRMKSFIIFEQTQADKAAIAQDKAKIMLEKEEEQIIKVLAALDKNFEKLEMRIHKLRGLRLQAGLPML